MPPEGKSAWERLGSLLADRRVRIAARYRNKKLFCDERGLHRRMLWSVEAAVRDTYTPDTIRVIESAYMLVPGSLDRTLAGGPLEPLPAPAAVPAPSFPARDEPDDRATGRYPHDRMKRSMYRAALASGMSEDDWRSVEDRLDELRAEPGALLPALRNAG